jgi:hypothetical protein
MTVAALTSAVVVSGGAVAAAGVVLRLGTVTSLRRRGGCRGPPRGATVIHPFTREGTSMAKQRVPRTRPPAQVVPPGHRLYRITINVLIDPADVDALTERLVGVLCPDASHEGDCAAPWSMITTDATSFDRRTRRGMLEMIRTTNPPSDYP